QTRIVSPCSLDRCRRERFENRLQAIRCPTIPADHQAITALEAPHSAARADIQEVNAAFCERASAADRKTIIGVASVDDDVVCRQERTQGFEYGFDDCG